ncbi:MAG: cysteine desulfurase NifS [Candidatus Omnitrophica bacterium]|nr:cysteine desulfurase NifS [Candidatus Omnitrophota bacterium]
MKKIYFDYAATAPTDPLVVEAMKPFFFEKFGNASSPHGVGREANKALEDARQKVATFIGAKSSEIIFTSGGTESNNHALFGAAENLKSRGNHIIVSRIEHHSVLEPAEYLEKNGFRITYLNADRYGMVDVEALQKIISEETIFVSVMHANNEIGTIQPIAEIGRLMKARGICFHVDAVQTVGHVPVDVGEMGVDLLSLSAHKFYGPKGMGALYIREGIRLEKFLFGGDQEKNRRASTQNVAGAVGLAKAIELASQNMETEVSEQIRLRQKLIDGILKSVSGARLNGHPEKRLPNNSHFAFEKVQGESLLMSLDMAGISASMGSACTSGALEPSHVLRATGLPDELAYGALRVTIGRWTKEEEIDYFLEQLPRIIKRLRD